MKIKFDAPALPKSGVFVIFASEGGKLSGLAAKADAATDGHVTRAMKAAKFEGKRDQMLDILAPNGTKFERIAVLGLGDPAKLSAREVELIGGTIAGALQQMKAREATVAADISGRKQAQAEARLRRCLPPARGSGSIPSPNTNPRSPMKRTALPALTLLTGDPAAAKRAFADLDAVAEGVHFARDLVNEPANHALSGRVRRTGARH